jgi:TP901 family phage tail tape measure protein
MMGAAMDGFAVYGPIRAYAGYENILRHIAITEKLSGAAAETEIKRLSTLFAGDALETGQSSESIARAYSDLVQGGISSKIIDRVIGQHSRAATAYNISAEALGPAIGALLQNMKIPEGDIGPAAAAMAYAGKEGRFKVENFSQQLPGVSGYLSLLGMTGRHNADIGFAALETIMKNSAQPEQAAAYFNDALHYITSPIGERGLRSVGINLLGLKKNARRGGIDPLDAVLGKLAQYTRGMDIDDAGHVLGRALHNQGAGAAIASLLKHQDDYLRLVKTLDKVGQKTLDTDYATASAAPEVQLRKLTEQTEQLNRTLGEGFAPTLKAVGTLLTGLLTPLTFVNDHFPKTTHAVLGTLGGFLLLAAGVGIFKVVAPLFVGAWKVVTASLELFGAVLEGVIAGLGLLLSPIGLVILAVAALALAAYEIYKHWDTIGPFFVRIWGEAKVAFIDFGIWAETWATSLAKTINDALHTVHFGFDLHTPFGPDTAVGKILHLGEMPQISGRPAGQAENNVAGMPGLAGTPSGPASLHVTVAAEPGTAVTRIGASVPVTTPNTGRTLNRP